MPFRKRRYKRRPKKPRSKYVKRGAVYARRGTKDDIIHYKGIGIPDALRLNLRYHDPESINLGGGTFANAYYQWRGSSIYDPNFTGTGGTPGWKTELASLYNKYYVIGSTITATFMNKSSSKYAVCAVNANRTNISPLSIDELIEDKNTKYITVPPFDGGGVRAIKMHRLTKEIHGHLTPVQNEYSAMNTNPSDPWFWTVMAESGDGSLDCNVDVRCTIVYHVVLLNKIAPT